MGIFYSYVRFSSKPQEKGDSVRRQDNWASTWTKENGHTLDRSLNLYDLGVSAFKNAHAETGKLAAFLKAIESGRVKRGEGLCVESLDRLSRAEVRKALSLFLQIIDAGVTIATKEGVFDDNSVNDTANLVMAIIVMSRSYDEGARKSDRQLNNWQQKRIKAKTHGTIMTRRCPLWLQVSEDKKRFDLIPERVDAIRKIFSWRSQGLGETLIVKKLHAEEIPPFAGKQSLWQRCSVILLLKDRRLIGEYQPCQGDGYSNRKASGEAIVGYYPNVIDEQFFNRVQAIKRRKTTTAPHSANKNLFSGLLHDARDKSKVVLTYSGNVKSCLISMAARDGKRGAVRQTFSYDAFEFGLLRWLRELQIDEADSTLSLALESAKERLAQIMDKIETVQEKVLGAKDCSPLLDLLEKLGGEQKEQQSRVVSLTDQIAASDRGVYATCLDVLEQLHKRPSDNELRLRVRVHIRSLISEIWMLATRTGKQKGCCEVQVHFRNGDVRRMKIWNGPQTSFKPGEPIDKRNMVVTISQDGLEDVDLRQWEPAKKTKAQWPKYMGGHQVGRMVVK